MTILYDTLLVPGVIYRKLDVLLADSAHAIAHTITCVVRNPRYTIELVQAKDRVGSLETVPSIAQRLDSSQNKDVLAAINGSFWSAGTRFPLGVSVGGGEIVALTPVPWHALWLDRRYRPWLDSAVVDISLRVPSGSVFPIASVNRPSLDGLTLYNRFVGDSIASHALLDSTFDLPDRITASGDTLDVRPGADSLRRISQVLRNEWLAERQRGKVLLRYLRSPSVNQPIPCVVLDKRDSGAVEVPLRGCVVSYPLDNALAQTINVGDTVALILRTKYHDSLEFHFAVSGTPVLVRNGSIVQALEDTTTRSSAFVELRLARSAVGTDVIQSVLYLVTVELSPGQSVGMSLRELAQFMRRFGAYQAINLDGGGSAAMVVGKRCVAPSAAQWRRPVANAIVIWRRRHAIR